MLVIEGKIIWSASDLSSAAECEYSLLRDVDYLCGRAERRRNADDLLQKRLATLGALHETRELDVRKASCTVVELPRVSRYTSAGLETADDATYEAFRASPDIIYQAAFFDGGFHGYADFIERTTFGWCVCDAKLSRSAKPKALLQLGAYAEQLVRMGLPVSPTVSLLLGNGRRADFPTDDVLPVFRERRKRLIRILSAHHEQGRPVQWGDERYVACGRCAECEAAVDQAQDVFLVAGLRSEQRRKLRKAGIETLGQLAQATEAPEDMVRRSFDTLQAQAQLQWQLLQDGARAKVRYELTAEAGDVLALLPAPSPGDLFFDFEGDPLYDEGDPARTGLEYLWGVMDSQGRYLYEPRWAHSCQEERTAFTSFMDFVVMRRAEFPDLHIYHYAPYETTALKRLMQLHHIRQAELDTLLREEVFVDLYSTVRGAIRVSASSYSIKSLEPLYMGDDLRNQEGVVSGGDSIVAYQEYRELRDRDAAHAQTLLEDLEAYNRYDCLSTLRLRDWLLVRATEAGVRDRIRPRSKAQPAAEEDGRELDDDVSRRQLAERLAALAGEGKSGQRTATEQVFAMLAAGLDFYRLERNVFWWEHYARLQNPIFEWEDTRDVFVVEQATVQQDWAHPGGKARNHNRAVRLKGQWAPGSRPQTGSDCFVLYASGEPIPQASGPGGGMYAAGNGKYELTNRTPQEVCVWEARKSNEIFAELPVALTPGRPPHTKNLEAAIAQVASEAADYAVVNGLPSSSALIDLLLRRPPRLRTATLPNTGKPIFDIVTALIGMDDSYLAIQGPPGTGKTYTGAHVIRQLVENHHWRIGVVGQSHAVVENMLDGIVKAGLDGSRVGKSTDREDPAWTSIDDSGDCRADFLEEHRSAGCVLGGTAWTFSNPSLLHSGRLDLLVVDEAGQFSLAATMAASVSAARLLLLGDPQQLPQVSRAAHADSVDEAALGWLMQGHDTLPPHFGYFLADSYRMHPALCAKVSTLSYERRLQSAPEASERHLEGVEPGIRVIRVNHTENRTESVEEAQRVVYEIQSLLGKLWQESPAKAPRPLAQTDFLVVAPYNAQVGCIRRALDDAGLKDVKVGTVDKFQGQEAPIAIVSMTASSHGDVPRGMAFLLNRNRVNVAVSRAKWQAIVVRSKDLTSYMPSSTEELLELGAFIGLCS